MSNTRENENQSVKNDLNRIVREGLSRLAQFSNPRRIISRTENMNLVSKNKDRQRDQIFFKLKTFGTYMYPKVFLFPDYDFLNFKKQLTKS